MRNPIFPWARALVAVAGGLLCFGLHSGLEAANRLYIEPQTVDVGAVGVEIPVRLDADQPLYAFSLSILTDETLLEIKSVTVAGTAAAAAQWADGTVFDGGRRITYGVVMTYDPFDVNAKIRAGTGIVIAKLVCDVKATAETTVSVRFEDVPAANPQQTASAKNVLVGEEGLPLPLTSQAGTITIQETSGPVFIRGDSNNDTEVDISDAVFHLGYLFLGGETPPCLKASDMDDNGALEITDAIYLLNYLFLGGSIVPPPFPEPGPDPTPDDLSCNL